MKELNRIKVVLVEKKRTSRWLASQLGKNVSTVSKWCTNTSQPDLQTLDQIADLLEVDTRDLIKSKRESNQ
jgi:transcriptional regulator with XRE-family HTH domain